MDLQLNIYVTHPEIGKFMGIGVFWLLQGIEEQGSIKKAAEEMDLSYAKAHTMLSNLEKALDRNVIIRKKGGSMREGAELTPYGKEFIRLYNAFQHDLKAAGENYFSEFTKKINQLTE